MFGKTSLCFLFNLFVCTLFCIIASAYSPAYSNEKHEGPQMSPEEKIGLLMFYKKGEIVTTTSRQPKSISQTAENITIITSEEIELTNAHTLSDVLNNIPGIQIEKRGGPGSIANLIILGSDSEHVLVMIDGIKMNNLSDNSADIASIPVQNIKRVEIIKGPASSSWGSALGGIVNIITKPVGESEEIGGTFLASYGERYTNDHRSEVYGKVGGLGYYFYAGNLETDGFIPNTPYEQTNIFTKLEWEIEERGDISFALAYNKGSRGMGRIALFDWSGENDFKYIFSRLAFNYFLNDATQLKLSLSRSRNDSKFISFQEFNADDSSYAGSAEIIWKKGIHSIVLGSDFDNGNLKSSDIKDKEQTIEKWSIFVNDNMIINRFSFTPGIRYDYTSTNNDFVSPSLGITYEIDKSTIIRSYVARGFNIPVLSARFGTLESIVANPDLKVEKVLSYHIGIESSALKYLWFKTTLFSHNISDAIEMEIWEEDNNKNIGVNKTKQRRTGVELEIKTVPKYNTSLFAGFSAVDAKNKSTDERLQNIARYTCDIGVQYATKTFTAFLRGHYIYWYPSPLDLYWLKSKYHAFIWDVNLTKSFLINEGKNSIDTFLTVHNIFDGEQYLIESFRNPKRWTEAGVRFKF